MEYKANDKAFDNLRAADEYAARLSLRAYRLRKQGRHEEADECERVVVLDANGRTVSVWTNGRNVGFTRHHPDHPDYDIAEDDEI